MLNKKTGYKTVENMISILLNTSTHKKSWWIVFIWKQQSYLSGDIGSNFIFLLYVILFWGFFSGCVNLLKLDIVNVLCLKYVCSGSSCSVIKFVSPWLSFKTFCNLAQLTLFPTLSKHKVCALAIAALTHRYPMAIPGLVHSSCSIQCGLPCIQIPPVS